MVLVLRSDRVFNEQNSQRYIGGDCTGNSSIESLYGVLTRPSNNTLRLPKKGSDSGL